MQTPRTVAVVLAALAITSACARAGNHFECVLEKMPGARTDGEAATIWKACLSRYGSPHDVKQGSGRGLLGFDSGEDCTDDKARDTRSQTAITMIRTACRRLYDDPHAVKAVTAPPEERGVKLGDLLQ